MKTLKMRGEDVIYHYARVTHLAGQALPYAASMAFGAVEEALGTAQKALASELSPFVEKHAGPGGTIGPTHPNHPAFVAEAAPVFEGEVTLELEPVPEGVLTEAARIMAERSQRGLGEPLVVSYADIKALKEAGVITPATATTPPAKRSARKSTREEEKTS